MTADDRAARRALEVVAFGRASTAAEWEAAAEAAEELRRLEAEDAAAEAAREPSNRDAEDGVVPPEPEPPADVPGPPPAIGEPEPVHPRGLLRRFWPVPAIAVAFLLGGVIGANLGTPSSDADTRAGVVHVGPTPTSTPTDPLSAGEAALDRPRSLADAVPNATALERANINPSTTHLISSSNGSSVWMGRDLGGSLCLIGYSSISDAFPSDCEKPQAFATLGVTLSFDAGTVHWQGASVLSEWKDE